MSKNAMAGAVTLCGVGLCMIGGALLMQNGQQAHAAAGSVPAVAALAATANAQAGPTVARHGKSQGSGCHRVSAGTWAGGSVERLKRLRSTEPMRMDNQDRPLPLLGASGA
jgi:hypothetical protein